jgi:hypothetical protein
MTLLLADSFSLLWQEKRFFPPQINFPLFRSIAVGKYANNRLELLLCCRPNSECFYSKGVRLRVGDEMMVELVLRPKVNSSTRESLWSPALPFWRLHYIR